MIPRILVPKDARPVAAPSGDAPRRLASDLDARTVVPSNLPHVELDPRTSIPTYFTLDVLGSRTVVPRDMPSTPLDAATTTPDYVPLTILDSRVAVPKNAHASITEPKRLVAIQDLPDVIDPDVLTTGEVNLMAQPVEARSNSAWNTVARSASIALHFVVILLILFEPKIFPYRPPTESEIARQNVTNLFMPPNALNLPKATVAPQPAPQPRTPQIHVDPGVIRQLTPPAEAPAPNPPEPVIRDTPMIPKAPALAPPPPPRAPDNPIQPPQPQANSSLILPRMSPGKALEDNMHEALKNGGGPQTQGFGSPVGPPGGGIGGSGGGGGGQGYMGGAVQMLTPDEGVDFSNYLARVLASVKRNWYAVIPESARLGDQGKVVLQFRIMRNGVVPDPEPALLATSGKGPLDRAALSSIRASTPFEPLPPAFSGPYIELRFIFLYNLPLSAQ